MTVGRRGALLPSWIGVPVSALYGRAVGIRNRRFDAGRGVVTLDRPVVSVGNLSVGGTGKTPVTARVVRWLVDAGYHPCIAMRGYAPRGNVGQPGGAGSDEAMLYAELAPGVPVVARPARVEALIEHFAGEGRTTDVVVMDDGFQHRRLARSCDIVLIDASTDPLNDRLVPAGWLREPWSSLTRASAVVVTHAEAVGPDEVDRIMASVGGFAPGALVAVAEHRWTGVEVCDAGGSAHRGVEWLEGKRLVGVCAIGNPEAFLCQAERSIGAPLAGRVVLRDHDAYETRTIRRILEAVDRTSADGVVTTAKDWVKLRDRLRGVSVARPVLDVALGVGGDALRLHVLARVAASVAEFGESGKDGLAALA